MLLPDHASIPAPTRVNRLLIVKHRPSGGILDDRNQLSFAVSKLLGSPFRPTIGARGGDVVSVKRDQCEPPKKARSWHATQAVVGRAPGRCEVCVPAAARGAGVHGG